MAKDTIDWSEKSARRVSFVPTLRDRDHAIAFDITDGQRRLKPTLVIARTVPGSIEWKSGPSEHLVRLVVSWVD